MLCYKGQQLTINPTLFQIPPPLPSLTSLHCLAFSSAALLNLHHLHSLYFSNNKSDNVKRLILLYKCEESFVWGKPLLGEYYTLDYRFVDTFCWFVYTSFSNSLTWNKKEIIIKVWSQWMVNSINFKFRSIDSKIDFQDSKFDTVILMCPRSSIRCPQSSNQV